MDIRQCSLGSFSLFGGGERRGERKIAKLSIIERENGKDVPANARTGIEKTVAFLLLAIEVVTKLPSADCDPKRAPISVLVVCPTRELATQAAAEADILLKYHPSIGVQVITGGTRLVPEQKHMHANPCQILVATLGRLRDRTENTPRFATWLMGVKVILDEAERLFEMGFRKDVEKIVAAVPKQRSAKYATLL